MPASPAVLKSINALRRLLLADAERKAGRNYPLDLYMAVCKLFQNRKIVQDSETFRAVLAFAPEIEASRGKGSQSAADEYTHRLYGLTYRIFELLPVSESDPGFLPRENEIPPAFRDVADTLKAVADHAFERVQGPPVRSYRAGRLRLLAWNALARIAPVLRRQEHLAHALAVAGNCRASEEERSGAVGYLAAYWEGDDPDKATVALFRALENDPPSRHFLVTVLQSQIEIGMNDEFGALFATGDWDDAHDND